MVPVHSNISAMAVLGENVPINKFEGDIVLGCANALMA